jgi:hypothetical protein
MGVFQFWNKIIWRYFDIKTFSSWLPLSYYHLCDHHRHHCNHNYHGPCRQFIVDVIFFSSWQMCCTTARWYPGAVTVQHHPQWPFPVSGDCSLNSIPMPHRALEGFQHLGLPVSCCFFIFFYVPMYENVIFKYRLEINVRTHHWWLPHSKWVKREYRHWCLICLHFQVR